MGIEVDGLDDAIRETERLAHGLTVEGVNEECNKIKRAANDCGIKEHELVLEAVPRGEEWDIKFELKDRSKLDCFKQAVRKILPSRWEQRLWR